MKQAGPTNDCAPLRNFSKFGKDTCEILRRHDPTESSRSTLGSRLGPAHCAFLCSTNCKPWQSKGVDSTIGCADIFQPQQEWMQTWQPSLQVASQREKYPSPPHMLGMLGTAHCYDERQHNCWTTISVGLLFQGLHAEALGPDPTGLNSSD